MRILRGRKLSVLIFIDPLPSSSICWFPGTLLYSLTSYYIYNYLASLLCLSLCLSSPFSFALSYCHAIRLFYSFVFSHMSWPIFIFFVQSVICFTCFPQLCFSFFSLCFFSLMYFRLSSLSFRSLIFLRRTHRLNDWLTSLLRIQKDAAQVSTWRQSAVTGVWCSDWCLVL